MSKKQERAHRAHRLLKDSVFQEFMQDTREAQAQVFLNPRSTTDEISEARYLVVALARLESRLQSAVSEGALELKREEKRGTAP